MTEKSVYLHIAGVQCSEVFWHAVIVSQVQKEQFAQITTHSFHLVSWCILLQIVTAAYMYLHVGYFCQSRTVLRLIALNKAISLASFRQVNNILFEWFINLLLIESVWVILKLTDMAIMPIEHDCCVCLLWGIPIILSYLWLSALEKKKE